MTDRQVGNEEFLDLAGAPEQARILRKALQQLADGGAGETLQEMAREVLAGRVGLRTAIDIGAYAEELGDKSRAVLSEWASMTAAERQQLVEEGERVLAAERADIDKERSAAMLQAGRKSRTRHDGRGWSLY